MRKIIIALILLVICSVGVFADLVSQNELRKAGIEGDVAYAVGYYHGYNDKTANKGSGPHTVFNYYGRTTGSRYTPNEVLVAKWNKGDYITGYKEGYNTARSGEAMNQNIQNLIDTYILTEEEEKVSTPIPTVKMSDIDLSGSITEVAYDLGYNDGEEGIWSNPTRAINDLKKIHTEEAVDFVEKIELNRGTFISGYDEGYNKATAKEEETQSYTNINVAASQIRSSERKVLVKELATKAALYDIQYNKGKRPFDIFRQSATMPVKPFTSFEVQLANTERGTYLVTYKAVYGANK